MAPVNPGQPARLVMVASVFVALFIVENCRAAPNNSSVCIPKTCYGDQCPNVTCDQGECDSEGACRCHPCWSGEFCDVYSNPYRPKFSSRYMGAYIKSGTPIGSVFYEIKASDEDLQNTCNMQKCDCAKLVFEITSGNSEGLFSVGFRDGKMMLEKSLKGVIDGRVYTLQLSLVNEVMPGKDGDVVGPKEYATLKITVGDGMFDYEDDIGQNEEVLERYKRQASVPSTVSNITFTLTKTGQYNYTTTMSVGSRVHFQLQIQFPPSQTIDLSVELFTPENVSTIMILCKPSIVYSGSNLQYNVAAAQPVLDANDGSLNYDRAVLTFGSVVNNGAATGIANVIQIEWDVVMIDSDDTVNGSYYWVSAGAEYNQQNEIWVGQAGFIAILDSFNSSTLTPQFNMSGPSSISIGSTAVFQVDMYLPYPSIELNFDVFSPFNFTDAASVCSVLIASVGMNYECYQYLDRPFILFPSESGLTNERATLKLGKVINKGSRDSVFNWTESRITMQFVIYIPYNDSLVGENLWIGSTVEIGTDQIWAGQMSFQVSAAVPAAPLSTPASTNIYPFDGTTSTFLHFSKALSLNVSLGAYTASNYTLTFTTDGTKYRTCAAVVKFRGDNIPCFSTSVPKYSVTTLGLDTNNVVWDLGTLENKNIRPPSEDPYASILQIFLYVVPIIYSGMAINQQATMSGTFEGSNSQIASFSQTLTLANVTEMANATGNAVPTANVTYAFGSPTINVNQTVDLNLSIAFYPQALNNPVTVTFTAPNTTTSSQFSIIRAEVLFVGKNLPCTQQFKLNDSFVYLPMPGTELYHTAILRAGSVNSMADLPPFGSAFEPSDDDKVTLRVLILINNVTPLPTTGSFLTTFTYTPTLSWNNTQTFTVGQLQNFDYKANFTPYVVFDYTQRNGSTVAAGEQFSTKILLKTAPKTVADWIIRADVSQDADLSLCTISVKEYGHDISYVNLSTKARKVASADPTKYSSGWLELYKLTNIGYQNLNMTSIYDDGSVVIEVLIQVSKSAAATSKSVVLSVDTGMNGNDFTANVLFNVGPSASYTYNSAAVLPNISFAQSKVNANSTIPTTNIYKGQTLILTTEFSYPLLETSHGLTIQILAPADDSVEIVEFNVVHVGQNFPCLDKRTSIRSLSKSSSNVYNNQGDLDLGMLCFVPINKLYPEQSKMRIEAIATIVRDSTISAGSTITISSRIGINGTVQSKDLALTIVASPPTTQDFNYIGLPYASISTDQNPVTMTSFSNYIFNASITALANTSDAAVISLQLPMGSISAVMTVVYFRLVSFGKNLGSVTIPFPTSTTYTSTKLTSQNDQASIDLGRITNTGHTYRAEIYQPGDDDIVVEVQVQMADAKEAVDLTAETVTYQFSYLGIQATNVSNVVASKPSTDAIVLILTPIVDSSITYNGGDIVSLEFNLLHDNQSRAEPFNANFIFYFPKFFDLVSATFQQNFINPASPSLNFNAGDKFFYISFPHVHFTDNITFSFQLKILPNMLTSNAPQEIVRLAYEMEMNANPKSTPTTPGTGITYPMSFINLTVTASPIQVCPSEVALGMGSGTIQDCQIGGSPGINDYINARHSGSGWIPGLRKGPFERYLQIRLGSKTKVTKVTITQKGIQKLKEILMQYSDDGINWANGDLITAPDSAATTDIAIPNPVVYSYVRLVIASTYVADAMPIFTIELWGCIITPTTLTAVELCKKYNGWQPTTPMEEYYKRGIALENSKGYLCDITPNLEDLKCFSTSDGVTWQALDKSVINILGYMSSKNRLYGLDKNKQAVVMSEDNGLTWLTVSKNYYLVEKAAPGFIPAKVVPWNVQIASTPVAQGAFSAKFDGLYYNSYKVADWMECCS